MKFYAAILIPLTLAGCAAGSSAPGVPPPPTTRAAIPPPPNTPTRMAVRGAEGVIDATAAQLVSRFGQPRIDQSEGDARKLQFAGQACLLDVYLYTLEGGGERRATWIDARNSSGESVDPAACIAALRR